MFIKNKVDYFSQLRLANTSRKVDLSVLRLIIRFSILSFWLLVNASVVAFVAGIGLLRVGVAAPAIPATVLLVGTKDTAVDETTWFPIVTDGVPTISCVLALILISTQFS